MWCRSFISCCTSAKAQSSAFLGEDIGVVPVCCVDDAGLAVDGAAVVSWLTCSMLAVFTSGVTCVMAVAVVSKGSALS